MTTTTVLLLASLAPADSGLHFGMLLSCRDYGDAFNSGRKNQLVAACTPEFGEQWSRVPEFAFHLMPKAGGGKLMGSLRTNHGGSVTVSTKQGIVTFILVETTRGWKVADIYRKNDDGTPISLKGFLAATLSANEFMQRLKRLGGTTYHENVTPEFRAAFEKWPQEDVDRIREFLPDPKPNGIPIVRLGDGSATVRARLPNGLPNEFVTFHLKDQGGWKIDDFSIESRTTEIPSFREALPLLASSMAFGEFCRDPKKGVPESVAAPGVLLEALHYAKSLKESPFPPPQKPLRFAIADDGMSAEMTYADRKVRIKLHCDECHGCRLSDVELKSGGGWMSVASLLLVKKRVSDVASLGNWFNKAASGGKKPNPLPTSSPLLARSPIEEPSVLVNASAQSGPSASEAQPAVAQEATVDHLETVGAVYVAPMKKTRRDPIRGASRRLSSAEMIRATKEDSRRRR